MMLPTLKKLDLFLKRYMIQNLRNDTIRSLFATMSLSFLTGTLLSKTEPIFLVFMTIALLSMAYNIFRLSKQMKEEAEIMKWSTDLTRKEVLKIKEEIEEELKKQEDIKEDIAGHNFKK